MHRNVLPWVNSLKSKFIGSNNSLEIVAKDHVVVDLHSTIKQECDHIYVISMILPWSRSFTENSCREKVIRLKKERFNVELHEEQYEFDDQSVNIRCLVGITMDKICSIYNSSSSSWLHFLMVLWSLIGWSWIWLCTRRKVLRAMTKCDGVQVERSGNTMQRMCKEQSVHVHINGHDHDHVHTKSRLYRKLEPFRLPDANSSIGCENGTLVYSLHVNKDGQVFGFDGSPHYVIRVCKIEIRVQTTVTLNTQQINTYPLYFMSANCGADSTVHIDIPFWVVFKSVWMERMLNASLIGPAEVEPIMTADHYVQEKLKYLMRVHSYTSAGCQLVMLYFICYKAVFPVSKAVTMEYLFSIPCNTVNPSHVHRVQNV